jgi:hypothetical protein
MSVVNNGTSHSVVMDTREINAFGTVKRDYVEFNMNGDYQLKCVMEHIHVRTQHSR